MTLFTLEKTPKEVLKRVFIFLGITAFIALFGFVYEQFSHGVYSYYMIFAWCWVLGFGVFPYLLILLLPLKKMPGTLTECVYNLGVAFITTRSIFIGVLEIYGKTNVKMVTTYTIISVAFLLVGFAFYITGFFIDKKDTE